jgi:diaminopimelate decarboxylase
MQPLDVIPVGPLVGFDGGLTFDGCSLADLAAQHGTPLWVVSSNVIAANYATFTGAMCTRWASHEVAYSMKAHNSLAVVRLLGELGAVIDCSSVYELEMALKAGVPGERIIVNGNGKSDAFLERAIDVGAQQINLDSLDEAARLDALAGSSGARIRCLVRLQLGYAGLLEPEPHFANRIRIGRKFGASVADGSAAELVAAVSAAANLEFAGYHHHVGFSGYAGEYSPAGEIAHHVETARELCEIAVRLEEQLGVSFTTLNFGGGFRPGENVVISRLGDDAPRVVALPTLSDYNDAVGAVADEVLGTRDVQIQFETGNYQIADAVLLLASVQDVKDVREPERRRIVTLDAGGTMMTLRAGSTMGFPARSVTRPDGAPDPTWPVELVGQSCVYDTLEEHLLLPAIERGDVLALFDQGAYCEVLSTQFNAIPRPAVVLVADGATSLIKRRETLEDILIREQE